MPTKVNSELSEPTSTSQISYPGKETYRPRQTASESAVLAREFGFLRDEVAVLNDDVDDAHRRAQRYDLEDRAHAKARQAVPSLLEELSETRGMAWRDIARLVGVSVSAVRKWRQSSPAGPENRLALAKLAAFLDLLEGFGVQDPATWIELPMVDGYTVRHMDLYEGGRPDLLLDLADLRLNESAALDLFDPAWRDQYRSDYEIFEAGDGQLSIRNR